MKAMSINWDEFKQPAAGEYPERWKPENIGDKVSGSITAMRVATMPDGTQYPSITLATDNGDREVLASQSALLRRLATLQPKVGDRLTIVHTGIEKLSGGRTLKQFDVNVEQSNNSNANIL